MVRILILLAILFAVVGYVGYKAIKALASRVELANGEWKARATTRGSEMHVQIEKPGESPQLLQAIRADDPDFDRKLLEAEFDAKMRAELLNQRFRTK